MPPYQYPKPGDGLARPLRQFILVKMNLPDERALSSISFFPVPFQDFPCKQSAGLKVIGEKVNKAAILAKNLQFLPAELLRKFE